MGGWDDINEELLELIEMAYEVLAISSSVSV